MNCEVSADIFTVQNNKFEDEQLELIQEGSVTSQQRQVDGSCSYMKCEENEHEHILLILSHNGNQLINVKRETTDPDEFDRYSEETKERVEFEADVLKQLQSYKRRMSPGHTQAKSAVQSLIESNDTAVRLRSISINHKQIKQSIRFQLVERRSSSPQNTLTLMKSVGQFLSHTFVQCVVIHSKIIIIWHSIN